MPAQRGEDEEFDSIVVDFSDVHPPERVFAEVIARTGQLDVLINKAGMMVEAAIEELSLEEWQGNLSVNLTAPFLLIRAALLYLRKARNSIVNTESIRDGRQPWACGLLRLQGRTAWVDPCGGG